MKIVKALFVMTFLGLMTFATMGQSKEETVFERPEFSKTVHLYPNPAIEYLSVKFDEPVAKSMKLMLHNILGSSMEADKEVVDEYEIRIRVKDLPTGYYLLAMKDDVSNQKGAFKFLKR